MTKHEALLDAIATERQLNVRSLAAARRDFEHAQQQLEQEQGDLNQFPCEEDLQGMAYQDLAVLAETLAGKGLLDYDDILAADDELDAGLEEVGQ